MSPSGLSRLESKPKDVWDVIQIIGAVLIPVAILVVGNQYSTAMKQMEIAASERAATQQNEVATANARVGQATVVASLLDALLSGDDKRVKLATEIVLVAMPDNGPALVQVLRQQGQSQETREYAAGALVRRREALIVGLFSEFSSKRQDAYSGLMSGWYNDSSLVPEVISHARENPANENGIYNSLVLLSHMNREALKPHVELVKSFSAEAETVGAKTAKRAQILRSRLPM